jgi:hypothetical protein
LPLRGTNAEFYLVNFQTPVAATRHLAERSLGDEVAGLCLP